MNNVLVRQMYEQIEAGNSNIFIKSLSFFLKNSKLFPSFSRLIFWCFVTYKRARLCPNRSKLTVAATEYS